MENTRFAKILRTFSKNEFRDFEKFVSSPYFSQGEYMVTFFKEVKRFYPEFTGDDFTKEKIFTRLKPKKKYDDAIMRKMISQMNSLVEEFLSHILFEKDLFKKRIYLMSELNERMLDDEFEIQMNKTERSLKLLKRKDNASLYFDSYTFYNQCLDYFSNRDYVRSLPYFQSEIDNFVKYFLEKSVTIYGEVLNNEFIYKTNFNKPMMTEVLKYAEENNFMNMPEVEVLFYALMIDHTTDEKYYYKLKESLQRHSGNLDLNAEINSYAALSNFGIRKNHEGETKFYSELGVVFKKMLEKGMFHNFGQFHYNYFINIATNLIDQKKYEEFITFIEEYKTHLNKELRDETVDYCYARLEFARGEFEKSLDRLSKINLNTSQIRIQIKAYLLFNYYELGLYENAYYGIDSYKHYLQRDDKLADFLIASKENFLKYYVTLLKHKSGDKKLDRTEVELLRKEIHTSETNHKPWLLEKLEEI